MIFTGAFYNIKINNFTGNFCRVGKGVMGNFDGGSKYFYKLWEGGLNVTGDLTRNLYKGSDSVPFGNSKNQINNIFKIVFVILLYMFRRLSH